MNPDHWQRVDEICRLALSRPIDERMGFVENACGTEVGLRKDVQSLLNKQASPGGVPALREDCLL
jgi:hypothetical protein